MQRIRKSILKKVFRYVVAVLFVGSLCLGFVILATFNNFYIEIDEKTQYQTHFGFGTSSAWTFQDVGKEEESIKSKVVDMLYSKEGLGLNIFRYNIGAGSIDSKFDDEFPYNEESFVQSRRTESFFIKENFINYDSFSEMENYDFSRDASMREMFFRCIEAGEIERIVFFANSPHFLMTESGKTTGERALQNNLKEEAYEAFSQYLLIITDKLSQMYLSDLDNTPEILISPVNEPQWDWGGDNASQEGCHFDPVELGKFYEVFFKNLKEFNLKNGTSYEGDIFECGNYLLVNPKAKVAKYLKEFAKYDYFKEIDTISIHSYGAGTNTLARNSFLNLVNKYDIENISMSEFCEMKQGRDNSMTHAIHTAKVIMRDINNLNVTDWSWWLGVSNFDYNDGLIYLDSESNSNTKTLSVLKRYYAFKQFSQYLSNGDVRVKIISGGITAFSGVEYCAYRKEDGSIVLILINNSNANRKIFLKGRDIKSGSFTNSEQNVVQGSFSGNSISLLPKSITTLIL
ncbi:MAG: hypothetical protein LBU04_00850 [Christensenellaceae bacterium]|jgi:O-glycosyl hydrolase|nr:hypothetical protein [Christensenellaceae bacterium]